MIDEVVQAFKQFDAVWEKVMKFQPFLRFYLDVHGVKHDAGDLKMGFNPF